MKKFIVWDKSLNIQVDSEFMIGNSGIIYELTGETKNEFKCIDLSKDSCLLFYYIGKKDINGKEIYADYSIVEFDHKIIVDKIIGYFIFNSEELRYEVKILKMHPGIGNKTNIVYDKWMLSNFKIIDTVQENKLGLIK